MGNNELLEAFEKFEADSSFLSENFEKIQKEYANNFVVIKDEKIIAFFKSFDEIKEYLNSSGINADEVLVEYIPAKNEIIIFGI